MNIWAFFLCGTILFLQYSESVYFLEHLEKEGGTSKFSYFHYLKVLFLLLCQVLKMLVSSVSQALSSLSFLLPYCSCSLQSRFCLQYSSSLQGFVLSVQRKFQLVHFKSSQNTKYFLLWFYWILENSLYSFCAVPKLACWDFHWAAYSIWDFSGHFNSHLPFLWSFCNNYKITKSSFHIYLYFLFDYDNNSIGTAFIKYLISFHFYNPNGPNCISNSLKYRLLMSTEVGRW